MALLVYDGIDHPLSGRTILGRHRSCTIQLKDDAASRQHAAVAPAPDGTWVVEDLGSSNGTKLNGKRIVGSQPLLDGDVIRIGESEVTFAERSAAANPEPATARIEVKAPTRPAGQRDHRALVGKEFACHLIGSLLGENTLGAVYRARHQALDRTVALTVIDPAQAAADELIERRLRQAVGAVGAVRHQALAAIHDCGVEDGIPWLSSEFIAGTSLKELITRQGGVEPPMALLVCERAAEALGALHAAKVAHGDVRPACLLIATSGDIKVVGAGLRLVPAASPSPAVLRERGAYLAPELSANDAPTPSGDIYALGCLLYALVEGAAPFTGGDAEALAKAHREAPIPSLKAGRLPAKLNELLQGLLAKNPAWRFADMAETAAEFKRLRHELGAVADQDRARRVKQAETKQLRHESRQVHRLRRAMTWFLVVVAAIGAASLAMPGILRARSGQDHATSGGADGVPWTTVNEGPATSGGRSDDDGTAAWQRAVSAIDLAAAAADWPTAERVLAEAATAAGSAPGAANLKLLVEARRGALAREADAWYRSELAKLPAGTTPTELAARLRGCAELRDRVQTADRADAESRYQEALARIGQQLLAAKREARASIAAGRLTALPTLANDLAPAMAGTVFAAPHAEFTARCTAAAGYAQHWAGTWALTRPQLEAATGAAAISAGALLLLMDETAAGSKVLDGSDLEGAALTQRAALFNREAAVLSFDDPGDLQLVEITTGEPRLQGGALRGSAEEPVVLTCPVPIGGKTWEAGLVLAASGDGQAVVSLNQAGAVPLSLRIEADGVAVRLDAGTASFTTRAARPADGRLRLRLHCRDGRLRVLVNDTVVLERPGLTLPAGAVLKLECAGLDWALDDLQVVGG
jgi:hypothetical protein